MCIITNLIQAKLTLRKFSCFSGDMKQCNALRESSKTQRKKEKEPWRAFSQEPKECVWIQSNSNYKLGFCIRSERIK